MFWTVCIMDSNAIEAFIKSLDCHGLQICQNLVSQALTERLHISTPPVSEYVDYNEKFIRTDSVEDASILADIETIGFKINTKSEAVQNKFISMIDEPYSWNSKKGPVKNDALPLDKFPGLKGLMERINTTHSLNLNSVLVSCYANGCVSVRAHDDGEESLDPQQPICVVSYGAKRKVEFMSKWSVNSRIADYKLEPEDRSIYIMKPGCQTYFRHRVRREHDVREHRISLSFRCFVPAASRTGSPPFPDPKPTSLTQPVQASPAVVQPQIQLPTSTPNLDGGQVGFSPFPGHHTTFNHSGVADLSYSQGERVCLLLGSSITTRVDESRMKRGSRVLINLSQSGAKICDLHKFAHEFCSDHPDLVGKVDKIIVNIGTNDVKWFNGVKFSVYKRCHLNPLVNLIRDLKFLFPIANITFIPMLPIRALYNYTAKTVNEFNLLLLRVCSRFGCIFFDCFSDFLSPDFQDYNSALFRDKWHPNEQGLGLLCRAVKCIVFGNILSSQVRAFWHQPFYA